MTFAYMTRDPVFKSLLLPLETLFPIIKRISVHLRKLFLCLFVVFCFFFVT